MMKDMIKIAIFMGLALLAVLPSMAQQERKFIREGNDLFEKQDFEKAEVEYRKAADKKNESFEAAFNMADALYKQKKYDEALQQFSALAKQETDKQRLGEIYHNIGNTLLALQKNEESIEAYKESLRNRPDSEATKYNLEFARHKQQQEQQDKDQNKDNKDQDKKDQDQKDQNKDNKDQNKDQDKKDQDKKDQDNKDQNKDQDKKDQDQKDQNKDNKDQNKEQDQKDQNKDQQDQNKDQNNKDQQGQQQQQGKISKEDAERLLEALQNDEKQVQEKVQKQKAQEQKAKKMKIEKDW